MRRLLLLSNSRDEERRYLHHPREQLRATLGDVRRVLFVPYASVTTPWADYTALTRDALAPLGYAVDGIDAVADPLAAVRDAEAIAVGGGNTFHLLMHLQRAGLVDAIRERALAGTPYVGWSAGSVVTGPTIRTTNDMPVVEPPAGLGALGLVAFQINAHYNDFHPPGFQGETRRQRLEEFVAANRAMPVLGLPEGDMVRVDGASVTLVGPHRAPIYRHGAEPAWMEPGASLAAALEGGEREAAAGRREVVR